MSSHLPELVERICAQVRACLDEVQVGGEPGLTWVPTRLSRRHELAQGHWLAPKDGSDVTEERVIEHLTLVACVAVDPAESASTTARSWLHTALRMSLLAPRSPLLAAGWKLGGCEVLCVSFAEAGDPQHGGGSRPVWRWQGEWSVVATFSHHVETVKKTMVQVGLKAEAEKAASTELVVQGRPLPLSGGAPKPDLDTRWAE